MAFKTPWVGIEPGDVGFDGGQGLFGWIIRRATGTFGHVWVYHEYLGLDKRGREIWKTVEAGPRGIKFQNRTRTPVKVIRLWKTKKQQAAILAESASCVGAKYGWGEIARLALHTIGIRVKGWQDNPKRMICSNHTARSLVAGIKHLELTLPYPPQHIWPQRLAEWCDWVLWTQARAKETRNFGNGD